MVDESVDHGAETLLLLFVANDFYYVVSGNYAQFGVKLFQHRQMRVVCPVKTYVVYAFESNVLFYHP